MKSIRVYQSGKFVVGDSLQLDRSSSNHLIKVLRLKNNYTFVLFNGEGTEYSARLEINGKKANAHILSSTCTNNESELSIHLLQGISKGDRMDFAIQKSIELGVTSITPVITERTVVNLKDDRELKKLQHWRAVAIGACEQSGRNFLPQINSICSFKQATEKKTDTLKILLDPLSENTLQSLTPKDNIQILIGPEGGLSDTEINNAKGCGFIGTKLGPRILRTETAALAAITSAQLLWGDLGK